MRAHELSPPSNYEEAFPAVISGNDPSITGWHKSTRSQEINCVEVGQGPEGIAAIRDSKDIDGPALALPAAVFAGFIAGVKAGQFERPQY